MCTLIVLHRCVPGKPLVVAANRDEFFARPAEPPAIRASRTGRIVAPRDLEAGGTWVGLSERGVFAGLTNLRPIAHGFGDLSAVGRPDGKLGGTSGARAATPARSRGEVVMAALEARTAAEAADSLSQLEDGLYNPFQLLISDVHSAHLLVYQDAPKSFPLEPGLHVVGNIIGGTSCAIEQDAKPFPGFEGIEGLIDTEEPRVQKLARIQSRVEKLLTEPGRDLFEGLARICREHVEPGGPESPFESTCVHVADRYGTRSSLLLELAEEVPTSRLWTTDGPPCRRPFENRSSLLRELGVTLPS